MPIRTDRTAASLRQNVTGRARRDLLAAPTSISSGISAASVCAASATAGGVAVPNELLARAEAPFRAQRETRGPGAEMRVQGDERRSDQAARTDRLRHHVRSELPCAWATEQPRRVLVSAWLQLSGWGSAWRQDRRSHRGSSAPDGVHVAVGLVVAAFTRGASPGVVQRVAHRGLLPMQTQVCRLVRELRVRSNPDAGTGGGDSCVFRARVCWR